MVLSSCKIQCTCESQFGHVQNSREDGRIQNLGSFGASFVDPFCYLCFMSVFLCFLVSSLRPCDHLLVED